MVTEQEEQVSVEDFAVVRETLIEFFADAAARGRRDDGIYGRREDALAALARLEVRIAEEGKKLSCSYLDGEGKNCGECRDCLTVNWHFAQLAIKNAEARITELEQERDYWIGLFEAEKQDRVAAEDRCEVLTAALREIIEEFKSGQPRKYVGPQRYDEDDPVVIIARRALATSEQARTEEGA